MSFVLGEDICLDYFVDAGFDESDLSNFSVDEETIAETLGLDSDDLDWDICLNFGKLRVIVCVDSDSKSLEEFKFFDISNPEDPKELTVYGLLEYC
jgi:hypothetical protein